MNLSEGSAGRGSRIVLLAVALLLVAIALAKPTLPLSSGVFRHLVVFDITQSMNVGDATPADAAPTRLEHAKAAVLEAAAALPCGSEIGLGLFAGHRTFLVLAPVEVCASYADISEIVRTVDWRMAWAARSEVAKGVHSGLAVAEALGPATSLVFLTDGHEAPPLHAELRPRSPGNSGPVRGLLAGIGGSVPMPIPKLDPQGGDLGYWGAEDVLQVDELSLGRRTSVPESYAGFEADDVAARIASGTEHLSTLRAAYLRSLARGLRLHYRHVGSADELTRALQLPDLANETATLRDLRPLLAGAALVLVAGSYIVPGRWRLGDRAEVSWRRMRYPGRSRQGRAPVTRAGPRGRRPDGQFVP
jgi:mxaL protein